MRHDNIYTIGGDVKTGIGFVHYLDTSYPNPTTMEGTIAFNTGETTDNCPETAYCSWRKDFNRTDDPLGKDAEKLTKASNGSDSSVCYKLVASGDYKKEYYVGDALDLSGIQLTAYWTGGKTTDVALKDVTISGYNKNEAGTQYVRLTYKEVNCLITITVIPRSSKITVSVSIYGDSKHGASGGVHGLAMGGLSLWANEPDIEADTTETVWDVLKRVFSKHSMALSIILSSFGGLPVLARGIISLILSHWVSVSSYRFAVISPPLCFFLYSTTFLDFVQFMYGVWIFRYTLILSERKIFDFITFVCNN